MGSRVAVMVAEGVRSSRAILHPARQHGVGTPASDAVVVPHVGTALADMAAARAGRSTTAELHGFQEATR